MNTRTVEPRWPVTREAIERWLERNLPLRAARIRNDRVKLRHAWACFVKERQLHPHAAGRVKELSSHAAGAELRARMADAFFAMTVPMGGA